MSERARRPHVLLIGGYLTEPFNYARVRRRLLRREAAAVSVAPIHVHDWLAAALIGFGPILDRTALAIRAARAAADDPIIVVGHSAGGICARLAMSPAPLDGHRGGLADAVGCLVTLGTPHSLAAASSLARHRGHDAVEALDASTPGAWFAPRTTYLSVASTRVRASLLGPTHAWGRASRGAFRRVVGPIPEDGSDGIVPVTVGHLEGARQITFPDVLHGHIGGPWYGDGAVIDRWWPTAVDLWRQALEARARD